MDWGEGGGGGVKKELGGLVRSMGVVGIECVEIPLRVSVLCVVVVVVLTS